MRDGSVLLTWLEPTTDKLAALRASFWRSGTWSLPLTITEQTFARHQSESPGVVVLSKTNLIAYWSQKPPNKDAGSREVDVYFSISTDAGLHWTAPTLANSPGTGQENSYSSAAPVDATRAALIWLDGRNWTKQKRVALMSRIVQVEGSVSEATVIDPDTCTCCPTSIAQTSAGLLAAYRGHTPDNIRDISLAQNAHGQWSQPHIPHPDNWHFAGCPVNGPHLDADGATTALVWFSAPQDQPEVELALSEDGGSTFSPPLRIDEGNVVGRAQAVHLPGRSTLAFWLERKSSATRLLARLVRNNKILDAPFEVARGSGLGYPQAIRSGNNVLVTWTVESPVSQIHVAVIGESQGKD
jgi:hypothetical protein